MMIYICFIFIYVITMYGLTNLLVYGSGPFNMLIKLREYCLDHIKVIGEMLRCMMCTSANLGWVISLFDLVCLPNIKFTPFNLYMPNEMEYLVLIIACDAFFTSGVVWLLHTIQETFESVTNYLNNKNNNE